MEVSPLWRIPKTWKALPCRALSGKKRNWLRIPPTCGVGQERKKKTLTRRSRRGGGGGGRRRYGTSVVCLPPPRLCLECTYTVPSHARTPQQECWGRWWKPQKILPGTLKQWRVSVHTPERLGLSTLQTDRERRGQPPLERGLSEMNCRTEKAKEREREGERDSTKKDGQFWS